METQSPSKESNLKDLAAAFQQLIKNGDIQEAFDKYVGLGFKHHNPYSAGNAKALIASMLENQAQFPNKEWNVLRTLEDNDLVAIHSKMRLSPEYPEVALVHIFKFKNQKIVELWDIIQQPPQEELNENGLF